MSTINSNMMIMFGLCISCERGTAQKEDRLCVLCQQVLGDLPIHGGLPWLVLAKKQNTS